MAADAEQELELEGAQPREEDPGFLQVRDEPPRFLALARAELAQLRGRKLELEKELRELARKEEEVFKRIRAAENAKNDLPEPPKPPPVIKEDGTAVYVHTRAELLDPDPRPPKETFIGPLPARAESERPIKIVVMRERRACTHAEIFGGDDYFF